MVVKNFSNFQILNEHYRTDREFEVTSVMICVRRTRDEEFEKPVDNYDSSSSSRGTLKKKQSWRWAARAKTRRKPSVHLVHGNDVSHLPGYSTDRRTTGSRTETRKCRNSSLLTSSRENWLKSVSSDKTMRFFFLFPFSSGGYRMMIGHMRLPFVELGVRRIRGY